MRDVGAQDGVVYVAMDLLPLSLARRLDILARLPETEVVRFALDVASALSIAHAEGIVHRDIKPDNVLLTSTGDAVVADFGLARALSGDPSLSEANQVMGTPHYFSPEQARSQPVDGRTDLYSLGVTMYRAATGQLPFEGDDWYAVARQHIEAKVTPLRDHVPELSAEFESVVMRLLAKRPEERFATATQLVDALLVLPSAPVRRGAGTPATSGDATQVRAQLHSGLARAVRRRRAYVAMLLVLSAVAGLVGLKWKLQLDEVARTRTKALADSVSRVALADSMAKVARDSLARDSAALERRLAQAMLDSTQLANSGAPNPSPPTRPVTRKGHLDFTASDSAQLFVDDLPVGNGTYSADLAPARRLRLRASVATSVVPCLSASHDTTVILRPGDSRTVHLNVAPCGVLTLTIDPKESAFTLTGKDFPFDTTTHYPGRPVSIVLRRGRYGLIVVMDRCVQYGDSVLVAPQRATGSDTVTRSVKLFCP